MSLDDVAVPILTLNQRHRTPTHQLPHCTLHRLGEHARQVLGIGGSWRRGRHVFRLNITTPTNFSISSILWDFYCI
jgi:hypothetical protein